MRSFIVNNITKHLVSLGLEEHAAIGCANKAFEFYQKKISNSRDPFKEACDFAGKLAMERNLKFKYKSPTSKRGARSKKPQEAFNFGE